MNDELRNKVAREESEFSAYIFSLCNEKVRAFVVQPTIAETKEDRLIF